MPTDNCFTPIYGNVMRLVRLDSCGNAVSGVTGQLVTDGFIKIDRKPQYEAGTEFIIKNARGDLCVNKKNADRLKRFDLTITMCQVIPAAIEMMTAARLLKNADGDSTGNAFSEAVNEGAFALEVWQETTSDACSGGESQYVAHVFPWVENGSLSDTTIEEAPSQWVINANTKKNANYGTGPFGLWTGNEAIGTTDHHAYRLTTDAPPDSVCGYQTLTIAA